MACTGSSLELGLPNLEGLEEWERRKIMSVLQRDLDIQKQKDLQIRRLRAEIEKLSEPSDDRSPDKCCFRCRIPLGLLLNSGAPCPKCHARVCVSCRVQAGGCRLGWMCILCDKTRQYAVLTGEWIQSNNTTQAKRGRSLTKSTSTVVLRVRNPNTENDYSPTAATTNPGTTEASISGMLLRQLREESMQSWKKVDTTGLPPQTVRNSQTTLNDEGLDNRIDNDCLRPRSPSLHASAIGRTSWRQSKLAGATSNSFSHSKQETAYPTSWSSVKEIDSAHMNSSNNVPLLRVEHIEEDYPLRGSSVRKSWREETMERSLLNAFNRGSRCPSVPGQLDTAAKTNTSMNSLLRVTNVRVSVRSTSSDNVSMASSRERERERSRSRRSKQHSDNDIRAAVVEAFVAAGAERERRRQNTTDDSKFTATERAELLRPVSQNSNGTTNDVSESWDDNVSMSGDSVISLSSSSVTSSVKKAIRVKGQSLGSLGSSYSSKITVQGEILLSCNYNCVDGSLEVHVIKCRNLYPMNSKKHRSNPYIKMYLLPDVSPTGKRKTRVKSRTVDPEYNEILKFPGLTKSEVEARTLLITAWHCDVLNRSHFMGEIRLNLADYPWIPDETYWYPFGPHKTDSEDTEIEKEIVVPDMMISLKFTCPDVGQRESVAGSLQCMVRSPQKLAASRLPPSATFYIKCYLYPDHRKQTKQKSPVIKLGADPTWKHTFVYDDVSLEDLRERCLELTVWTHQRMSTNEFLGGIRLNVGTGFSDGAKVDWMDGSEEEALIWKDMLYRPNTWVDATLPLRPDMETKL